MTEQRIDCDPVKCAACGRFVSYSEMENRTAHFHFEPDSHKGPEVSEWTCAECVNKGAP